MNRKEELSNYLNLLLHLESKGINCKVKITEALEELHKIMGFRDKPELSMFIEKVRNVADEAVGNIHSDSKGRHIKSSNNIKGSPFDVFG